MEWTQVLTQIFEVCIIPLLGVLTAAVVQFVNVKKKEFAAKSDNDLSIKYSKMLADTITDCVIATNQTYVNVLKEQGAFDKEAQKEAFRKSYEAVITILSDDAKEYLSNAYGDLAIYITQKIEAEVNSNK